MLVVIFGKPNKSVSVIGYGVSSYKDKEGKEIWMVYGIVSPATRGRLVSRDSTVVKDIYTDEATVVVFRSSDKADAETCKTAMDKTIANHYPLFSVEAFKEWLAEDKKKPAQVETKTVVKADGN